MSSTPPALDSRQICTRAPVARTSSRIVASAMVSANAGMPGRPRRVATSPSCAHAALREPGVFGAQPYRVAEGRGVLQRAPQHLRVGERRVRLGERDAAGVGELPHLGERLAGELHRERADRIDARARQRLGAPAQHVDQPRLVERRVGVRRAGEAGDAAGERGVHLRFERRLVLVARLAQPRREVDEARRDDQALGVDDAVGLSALSWKSSRRR